MRTRTEAEVIDMAKHGLRGGAGAPKSDTSFSLAGKRSKTDINSDATARDQVFSDVDVNIAGAAPQKVRSLQTFVGIPPVGLYRS